jgi:hypothetical protein
MQQSLVQGQEIRVVRAGFVGCAKLCEEVG